MIHHLSYPRHSGQSVNANIPSDFTHVSYETIDRAIAVLNQLGRNSYMSKTDIQSAFRIVPVHPDDYPLLGFKWQGFYYYDRCLPMGAASSCQIFEAFSSALKWATLHRSNTKHIVKILDDFLFLAPSYGDALSALNAFRSICSSIGVPLNADKTFLPSQIMIFLGITLDSTTMEARLPLDKVAKATDALQEFASRSCCTLRELLSLIGLLSFACSVIRPGRAFLRRLVDLSIGVRELHFRVRLGRGAKEDISMWLTFLHHFNGSSLFIYDKSLTSYDICLQTDASSFGYGAIFNSKWFYGPFPTKWRDVHISFLEFYPIVAAVYTWGHLWKNHSIVFLTDNEALVSIINRQTSKLSCIMFLVRKLVLRCLHNNIEFKATHVPGKQNHLADALSRFQIPTFLQAAPHCDINPTILRQDLLPESFCRELNFS